MIFKSKLPAISINKSLIYNSIVDRNIVATASICFIIVLGATLRFYSLGTESYWQDEVTTIQEAGGDFRSTLQQLSLGRGGSLYILLAHFWIALFGAAEIATRSLSALAGVTAILVLYITGVELFGRRVALISALLMALASFQVLHSQNFRYYSLYVLLTLLSYLFFIRALQQRRIIDLGLYLTFTVLLYYAHTTAIFIWIAQGLYFLLHWKKYRDIRGRWLLGQTLILLGIGPDLLALFIQFLQAVNHGTMEAGNFRPMTHLQDPPPWLPLYTLGIFIFTSSSAAGNDWIAVLAAVAFFGSGALFFMARQGKAYWLISLKALKRSSLEEFVNRRSDLLLIGLWLLCPIVMPFIISKLIAPMYLHRYTISASPAFYLLLALAISHVRKVVPEFISVGALVILMGFGLQDYYTGLNVPPWREITAYISENSETGYGAIFDEVQDRKAFAWYYPGPNLSPCYINPQKNKQAIIADLEDCSGDNKRIWLVSGGSNPMVDVEAFFKSRFEIKMHLIQEQHFSAREKISVYLFELD